MKRLLLLALLLLGLSGGQVRAATKTYSTGNIDVPITAGGTAERTLSVPDAGPIWFVRVELRIEHPRPSELSISLVSPAGTVVPISVHRGGAGANFGTGSGCSGQPAVFDDDQLESVATGSAPFAGLYRPEQPFATLNGEEARGRWTLRITDDAGGHAGTLLCWSLTLSRNVTETVDRSRGDVRASFSYRERKGSFLEPRLKIVRNGRTALDVPLRRFDCGDCRFWRFTSLTVRDLDGGDPEVIFDAFTGGVHCCIYSEIYRYDPARRSYRQTFRLWGNYGYRLADYDGDGRPELRASDERFVYRFTAYASSAAPIQIWHFDGGRLVDVTRRFPRVIAGDADELWHSYLRQRGQQGTDVRGVLAAFLAEEYLLGRGDEGLRRVNDAVARGDVGRGKSLYGWPAGRAYLKALLAFLKKTGYAPK